MPLAVEVDVSLATDKSAAARAFYNLARDTVGSLFVEEMPGARVRVTFQATPAPAMALAYLRVFWFAAKSANEHGAAVVFRFSRDYQKAGNPLGSESSYVFRFVNAQALGL